MIEIPRKPRSKLVQKIEREVRGLSSTLPVGRKVERPGTALEVTVTKETPPGERVTTTEVGFAPSTCVVIPGKPSNPDDKPTWDSWKGGALYGPVRKVEHSAEFVAMTKKTQGK